MYIVSNKEVIAVNQGKHINFITYLKISSYLVNYSALMVMKIDLFITITDPLGVQAKKVRMEGDMEVKFA